MLVLICGLRWRMWSMRVIRGPKWKQVPSTSKDADLGMVKELVVLAVGRVLEQMRRFCQQFYLFKLSVAHTEVLML